jgi:alpha-L-fucosidase 2
MKSKIIWNSVLLIFLLSCGEQEAISQAEQIISKHAVVFSSPPSRIPDVISVDAPLLGNGYTGIAISGKPEEQIFYAARNDFWRLTSAYKESFPAVLAKIKLSIPELEHATYHVEQNLFTAVTTASFKKDELTIYYRAYVSATEDLLIVEVGMHGSGAVRGVVELEAPGEKEIINNPPLNRSFPSILESNVTSDGTYYLSRSFIDSVEIQTKAAVSLRVKDTSDGSFTLEEGKPARFVCAFSSNFKSKNCVQNVIEQVSDISDARISVLERNHEKWWREYWEKSYVVIPDKAIEKQYYLSLYGMASCSRDPDFPPSLFGSWVTAECPNWSGDYHLNYNHQAPYYALYSANRIEQADPYYAPLLEQIPRGYYYGAKVTGVEGILLPVGIGPLGMETTRRSNFMERYFSDRIERGFVEDEGFFWGQKSNAAYSVTNLSMQFYHTWDVEFTRKVYPFVKGVAMFWKNYLTYEDGRYVIYNDAIHEGTNGDFNPISTIGLVKQVMQTAVDMSQLLDVDDGLRREWKHIGDNMAGYSFQEINGKTVFRYTEKGTAWGDDNTLGIQHIYPAGQIGLDSDQGLREVAINTLDVMQRWMDSNGSNSFFPAAVRVGYHPQTILEQLNIYSRHTFGNGFQKDNAHGPENWSTVPNTINEMLCMGHQGVLRLFPAWPRDLDASFYQIRSEGAFLVSAEIKNSVIKNVSVTSEKGRDLCLQSPWKGKRIKMKEDGNPPVFLDGDILMVQTKPGKRYEFFSE